MVDQLAIGVRLLELDIHDPKFGNIGINHPNIKLRHGNFDFGHKLELADGLSTTDIINKILSNRDGA